MAKLPDPVLQAISQAVTHALAHMEVVQRDADRLTKKNGCCLPSLGNAVTLPCCTASPTQAGAGR